MASIEIETTPNPNSLKFSSTSQALFHEDVVAISSEDEADRHELGEQLFSLDGVEDVFITPEFVTVSKTSTTDWSPLKDEVKSTLTTYLENA